MPIFSARDAGIIFVASAGNGPPAINIDAQPLYPAAYQIDNIVSVAYTTPTTVLARCRTTGRRTWTSPRPASRFIPPSAARIRIFSARLHHHRGHFVRGCHDVGSLCLNARQVPGGNPSGDHRPGARRNRSLACPRRQMRHRRPAQPAERAQPANSANAALQPRQRTVSSCACPAAPAALASFSGRALSRIGFRCTPIPPLPTAPSITPTLIPRTSRAASIAASPRCK